MRILITAGLFVLVPAQAALADFSLVCDLPEGRTVAYGTTLDMFGNRTQSTEDGVRRTDELIGSLSFEPTFRWSEARPQELVINWPDPRTDPYQLTAPAPYEQVIPIYYVDEDEVMAVTSVCGDFCVMYTFAVFPKLGFVTRTESGYDPGTRREGEGLAVTRTYSAKCRAG